MELTATRYQQGQEFPVLIKPTGLFIKKMYTFMILCSFKSIYFNQKGLMRCKLFFQSINLFAKGDRKRYFLLSVFIVPRCVAVFIFSCIAYSSDCCHNHYIRSHEFIPG